MATNATYLITGASRGLGYGLVRAYLGRPNTTVIAGVRNPSINGKALNDLHRSSGSKLIIVKIDSTSASDANAAIQNIRSEHGIQKLDVVIANAGIGASWEKVLNTSAESIREYTEVNIIGPLLLFQAAYPLLAEAPQPKFFVMATGVSSFGLMEHYPIPAAGYGASKAGITYITRKIHFEHPNITSVNLFPGWSRTEMGNAIAKSVGMKEASISVEESVKGVMTQVDAATRDTASGKFIDYEGKPVPW